MQIFDIRIDKTSFTFIRVPYSKGELWYHISFPSNDKRLTFRMCENLNNKWIIFDTKERWILDLQYEFNQAIDNFENSLLSRQEDIGQSIKVAS